MLKSLPLQLAILLFTFVVDLRQIFNPFTDLGDMAGGPQVPRPLIYAKTQSVRCNDRALFPI